MLSVISVSFVSTTTGWALGTVSCGTGQCLQLWKTRDSGRTWTESSAPPVLKSEAEEAGSGVRVLRFANTEDGWAFLPDLWATHDGGSHWVRQSIGEVFALEAASGAVHAVVFPVAGGQPGFNILTSPVHADAWQPSTTTLQAGAGPIPEAQLVLYGPAGWVIIVNRTVVSGARLDHGRWVGWQPPCTDAGGAATLAAASASDLVAVCNEGQWNDRPQMARAYRSGDGGASFRPMSAPLPVQAVHAFAAAAPGIWVVGSTDSQSRTTLLRTADGGRTWRTVHRDAQGGWLELGFTSPRQGVAVSDATPGRLLMTFDGGQTWAPVPSR
ncbi:MAG: hypothetical protein LC792_00740 [Actinobacteria bacterium]|nr:hypothetical protein [Actinomycetota bacterium]